MNLTKYALVLFLAVIVLYSLPIVIPVFIAAIPEILIVVFFLFALRLFLAAHK